MQQCAHKFCEDISVCCVLREKYSRGYSKTSRIISLLKKNLILQIIPTKTYPKREKIIFWVPLAVLLNHSNIW